MNILHIWKQLIPLTEDRLLNRKKHTSDEQQWAGFPARCGGAASSPRKAPLSTQRKARSQQGPAGGILHKDPDSKSMWCQHFFSLLFDENDADLSDLPGWQYLLLSQSLGRWKEGGGKRIKLWRHTQNKKDKILEARLEREEWAPSFYSHLPSVFFLSSYRHRYSNRVWVRDNGMSRPVTEQELGLWRPHSLLSPGPGTVPGGRTGMCCEWTTQSVPGEQHWLGGWIFFPLPIWYFQISSCTLWDIQMRSHIYIDLWTFQGNSLQYR